MECDLDLLTLMLLDPCLTTDEAVREAAARAHTALAVSEVRANSDARRKANQPRTATECHAVGF